MSLSLTERVDENNELTHVSDINHDHFIIATSENLFLTKQLNVIHTSEQIMIMYNC